MDIIVWGSGFNPEHTQQQLTHARWRVMMRFKCFDLLCKQTVHACAGGQEVRARSWSMVRGESEAETMEGLGDGASSCLVDKDQDHHDNGIQILTVVCDDLYGVEYGTVQIRG